MWCAEFANLACRNHIDLARKSMRVNVLWKQPQLLRLHESFDQIFQVISFLTPFKNIPSFDELLLFIFLVKFLTQCKMLDKCLYGLLSLQFASIFHFNLNKFANLSTSSMQLDMLKFASLFRLIWNIGANCRLKRPYKHLSSVFRWVKNFTKNINSYHFVKLNLFYSTTIKGHVIDAIRSLKTLQCVWCVVQWFAWEKIVANK